MTLPLVSETLSSSKFELPLPPDLLRRFVACPHRGSWSIAGVLFDVETNCEALLRSFALQQTLNAETSVQLKVIVDPDIPLINDGYSFLIDSGEVCWGCVGGLLFAFDRDLGEFFLFVPKTQVESFSGMFQELLHAAEPILSVPNERGGATDSSSDYQFAEW